MNDANSPEGTERYAEVTVPETTVEIPIRSRHIIKVYLKSNALEMVDKDDIEVEIHDE